MSDQQIQKKWKTKIICGYQLGKKIGTGTFATVKQGIHIKTKQKVAIKILRKKLIIDTRDKINLSRQLRIIQKLRHPNIVQLLQILENNNKIYLIMEHVQGGQLFDLIVKNQKSRLDQQQSSIYLQQLINTIQYLHSLGVTHRDIKPENILIAKNNTIKIIDFGLSNLYQPKDQLITACGSPCYAAPQMLNQKSYDPLKVDLWSCGVVLYTMLVGYLPFEHQNTSQLYKLVSKQVYDEPSHLSDSAKDILRKMLQINPDKRLSIQQIRNHPFCSRYSQPISKGLMPNEKINIDLQIVQSMKDLGYNGFIKDLQNNILNENTAAFYLLLKKKLQQNDINSDIYYRQVMQRKNLFRSKSITMKRYQQKNPQQLPQINNKRNVKSFNNINKIHNSEILLQIKKRAQSNHKFINPIRIKRIIK